MYGSLFPFIFSERGTIGDAVTYLLATPAVSADRGDELSNILLYIPLGLFGARSLEKVSAGWRVLIMAIAGGALSAGIEIAQFFDRSRATELSDLTANFAGAVIGGLVEIVARGRIRRSEDTPFAVLLISAGLGTWLYPFVPSLHIQATLSVSSFEWLAIFKQTVVWLAVGALVELLAGAARVSIALPAMAAFVILARLVIPQAGVTGSDVAGISLGVAGWLFVLSGLRARLKIVAGLFAAFIIVDAFRPFVLLSSPRAFGWLPFGAFISGPRGNASRVFLEKTFLYGSLLWLFHRSGLSWLSATLWAAGLVLGLRLAQTWIPDRSAEISDVMMVLILAAVMKVLAR